MNADSHLLLGIFALQAELIDSEQFIEACTVWTTRKSVGLADVLVDRGWLSAADKDHLECLVLRRIERQGTSNPQHSLAALPDYVRRSLAALDNSDIQQSLAPRDAPLLSPVGLTVDYLPPDDELYHLVEVHATGGIGLVWRARDRCIGRDVALKELKPEHAANPQLQMRFLREGQITGQLEHPGLLPIYHLGWRRVTKRPFYTMRFLRGQTLSEAIRAYHQKRREDDADSGEFLRLLAAFGMVCNTIAYAHSRGILHRDLKSDNIALGDFGEVVVLDWGLAKVLGAPEDNLAAPCEGGLSTGGILDTMQGQILGTPSYMSPEQAAGRHDQVDERADVYGLGAILYEILVGRPPFIGTDLQEVLRCVRQLAPVPPRQLWDGVPPPLEAACLRALAKEPGERFSSATELGEAVQQWQEIERRRAEDALRTSEALYHSLVETIPMNVWRKDAEGRFTFANQGFCAATGRSLEQLLGKTDFDLFPPELAQKYRSDDAAVLATGETFSSMEEHLTANQEVMYVRVVKLPVQDANGKTVGTQGMFWDVTDVRRLECALEVANSTLAKLRG